MVRIYLVIVVCGLVILNLGCGIVPATLSRISISPVSATIGLNRTRTFTSAATYSSGSSEVISPAWSVTGGVGSISSSGIFTATAEGSGTVYAVYQGMTASTAVTVTAKGNISGSVKSSLDGSQISGIKVYLSEEASTYYDTTAANGAYSISNIIPGNYILVARPSNDYLTSCEAALVSTAETTTKNLYLSPRIYFYTGGFPVQSGDYLSASGTLINSGSETAYGVSAIYTFYYDTNFGPLPIAASAAASPPNLTPAATANFLIVNTYVPDYNGTYTRRITITSLESSSLP